MKLDRLLVELDGIYFILYLFSGIINGEVWAITKNDQKYLKKCL
jgi:hypothetical protein